MTYELASVYDSTNFFNQFSFFSAFNLPIFLYTSDPTHGFVQYVDANTARTSGLTRIVNNTQIYVGVDNLTTLNYPTNNAVPDSDVPASTANGRKSVRLESRQTFDWGLLIADFAHIPSSICGTWPAYWTYNYAEDPYGEVDIIEGVNNQIGDVISMHTGARCRLDDDPQNQTGTDSEPEANANNRFSTSTFVAKMLLGRTGTSQRVRPHHKAVQTAQASPLAKLMLPPILKHFPTPTF
uniref:Putative endo-1,3(4)-beta-glucanase n=1 Tax=Talaromyces marneffei PM1 TaxID=1077442 RepID=A0A093V9M9_TALMA